MSDKLIMPAGYTALSGEELTYTQGGGVIGVAASALLIYNYVWGIIQTRNWLKNNQTGSAVSTAIRAYNATIDYIGASVLNTVRGVITAMQFSLLWPVTAVAWLTAKGSSTQSTGTSVYSSVSTSAAASDTTAGTAASDTKIIPLS